MEILYAFFGGVSKERKKETKKDVYNEVMKSTMINVHFNLTKKDLLQK